MRLEHGKLEGDLQLHDKLQVHGMVTGNVRVTQGGVLLLHGMCCQDVTLEMGATVYLYGTVSGNVYNRAGHLEVFGMIVGSLHTDEGAITLIDPKARILEQPPDRP